MKRNKTYLVKKNVDLPGADDNWIIMNGYEFSRFIETEEGQRRRRNFAKLDGFRAFDVDYIIECDQEKAREIDKERKRSQRCESVEKNCPVISFNVCFDQSETLSGEDVIADPDVDVEATALINLSYEVLHEAINMLSPSRVELIRQMFLNNDYLSLQEYAAYNGINNSTAHERKERTLNFLKKYLTMCGYDPDFCLILSN